MSVYNLTNENSGSAPTHAFKQRADKHTLAAENRLHKQAHTLSEQGLDNAGPTWS